MKFKGQTNKELDVFLDTLSKSLNAMPAKRRQREIDEIRAHIEEIAKQNKGYSGYSTLAIRDAIKQMGDANEIGSKLTMEWQQGSTARRFRLIRGIIASGFAGGLAVSSLWQLQFVLIQWRSHESLMPIGDFNLMQLAQVAVMTTSELAVFVIVGIWIARSMPKESDPQSVLPASIYTGLFLTIVSAALKLSFEYIDHIPPIMLAGPTVPFGYPFFQEALSGIYYVGLISICSYAAMLMRGIKLAAPSSDTWKLRIE